LNSISLFLLLDLLGEAKPTIPSYFETTHWAYQALAKIESRYRALNIFQSKVDHQFLPYADVPVMPNPGMQDDHLPFLRRGVEVLHIIPSPFPDVWHKIQDDAEHLDMPTVEDWAQMVTAFAGEWLDLEGHFPNGNKAKSDDFVKTEL
jgi:glutaminyl-peptide cyclotransferase